MKLLVGRLVLGCILAVLVLADEPVVEKLEETVKSIPEVAVVVPDAVVDPLAEGRIFAKPGTSSSDNTEQDIIVIPDQKPHNNNNNDNDNDNDNDDDNDNDHNKPHRPWRPDNEPHHHHTPQPRPPSHHHHMPMPSYQYPPYYPPYYPPPPPPPYYGPPVYAPVPPQPYPYYPPQPYYPSQMKPITVIHNIPTDSSSSSGSSSSGSSSSGSSSYVKPTDLLHQSTGYLWNLIDQKNSELWNLLSNKLSSSSGSGSGSGSGSKGDTGIHEIVVINAKPGTFSTPTVVSSSSSSSSSGSGWHSKGKNFVPNDCNNK